MENTISFSYNPQKYFNSYQNVLEHLRTYYVDSDVYIFFDSNRDDIEKYKTVSDNFNCKFNVREDEMFFIDRKDSIEINKPKMLEWVTRLKYVCENTDSEWVMLLEDDVVIKRKIVNWPNSDCGKNRENTGFLGGGSIFKKEKFLEIFTKISMLEVERIITNYHRLSWAGDVLLKFLFETVNASSEKWIELAEPGYYDNIDHAIFHGYKELHNT
jgi:hypothetical protein